MDAETRGVTASFTLSTTDDVRPGRGPMLLDFGAGLIRHEASNDDDMVECDVDLLTELGVDQLCDIATSTSERGVCKRWHTEMPDGQRPSQRSR